MNRQTSTTMAPVSGGEATRRLLPFAMMVFLGYLTVGLPLAVLPVHVHDRLGFGPVIVGWVMASQSIATLLTRQFGGVVTDARASAGGIDRDAAVFPRGSGLRGFGMGRLLARDCFGPVVCRTGCSRSR